MLALSFDSSNLDTTIKVRLLLLTIAKIIDWNVGNLSEIDINNLADWSEIAGNIKTAFTHIVENFQNLEPSISFKQIEE